MRTFTAHHIRYRASRVQAWAFYAGVGFALAWIGFAILGMVTHALVTSILGSVALGISIGAWVVGAKFND